MTATSEDRCVVCKEKIYAIDGQIWIEEGPVHHRCAATLPCSECNEPVGSTTSFVDPYRVPFDVPPDKRNHLWHPYCALRYQHRETKRAQIEITAAAIVKACQESPLRELIAEAMGMLRGFKE